MNGRHQKELSFVVPVYYHIIKLPVSTKYTQVFSVSSLSSHTTIPKEKNI